MPLQAGIKHDQAFESLNVCRENGLARAKEIIVFIHWFHAIPFAFRTLAKLMT